ncbi:IS66-like element accessory protein TnpA [Teichococcus aestuarii]|uniref:IS66-like element accessory protein TnpA n=1 Tax=Teichococcus aestuarii TaxID=568898 RepID=UPI003619812A
MEIINGLERRRRWRAEDKLRIVAEVEAPGACFAEVARRHDVSRGLLWNWRRDARRGQLARRATGPEPMFLPIQISDPPPAEMGRSEVAQPRQPDSRIEIVLPDGTCVRVGADVDAAALRRVLTALRR